MRSTRVTMDDTRSATGGTPRRPRPGRVAAGAVALAAALALASVAAAPEDSLHVAPGDTAAAPPDSDSLVAVVPADITGALAQPTAGTGELLPPSPHPFGVGESLRFSVQYGVIHAGTAWLEVPAMRDVNGHESYVLVARAESNGFFSAFYKVRNRIESVWDKQGRFSWHYSEDRHEGHFKVKESIDFDPANHEARYRNGQVFTIPNACQDALSSFYFTRYQALPLGGSIQFDYHASHKSAPMEVKVLGRQSVKTPAGRFNCVVVEPVLKAGGIFKNNGRLVIWLTDDERRMPVLMKSKVMIGSISVVLQEAKPGV